MTLFDIYELVEFVCNKDFSGNIITPDMFAKLIKVVNLDHFREKYGLPEEYQPRRPVPNEQADITLKNTDDLKAFKVFLQNTPVTNGVLPYPTNPAYAHRDTITYNYSKTINGVATVLPRPVEILKDAEFASRMGNYTKRPTATNPIGVLRSYCIFIEPWATITHVDFSYYRFPVTPVFAYVQNTGFITYDAPASTEFEYPQDEMVPLASRILKYIGVNLREAEIVQVANQQLQTGK